MEHMKEKRINELIDALPEIYQNIYGHPEYNKDSSRKCDEREADIVKTVSELQRFKGKKNLRVLDVGCAQGYFSLVLASMGCDVYGIDYLSENIALCSYLKEEQDMDNVSFEVAMLSEDYVSQLSEEFDVILLFSIMHHVAVQNGFEKAKAILEKLAGHSSIIITEMALKQEPVYWNTYLPDDYSSWFDDISFFDELSFYDTHLSDVKRPLLVCSNKLVFLNGKYYLIDSFKMKSYGASNENPLRRYYFSDDLFIKLRRAGNPGLTEEINKEICFLKEHGNLSFVPELIDSDSSAKRAYIIRKSVGDGEVLSDYLQEPDAKLDYEKCFVSVLDSLIELENAGLYYGDLRLWNVIYDSSSHHSALIDFGNVQDYREDSVAWNFNKANDYTVYDSFISFVFDVLTNKDYGKDIHDYGMYNLSFIYDMTSVPDGYADFIKECVIQRDQMNFSKIKQLFLRHVMNKGSGTLDVKDEIKYLSVMLKRIMDDYICRFDYDLFQRSYPQRSEIRAELDNKLQVIMTDIQDKVQDLANQNQLQINCINAQIDEMKNHYSESIEDLKAELEVLRKDSKTQIIELQDKVTHFENWIVYRVYNRIRKVFRRG